MCGISGIVSKEKRLFDYSTFCTLGIANDSRGGDSCGIFIDGEVEYGTGTYNKFFQNFMFNSKLLMKTISSKVALLHCRKASVGAISEATAQPVVLKDKAGNVKFVLLHNGTIYNYKELAKKYIPKVNIEGLTDSQVMARIFFYKGYDALDEYYGGAVFAIIDYRQPNPSLLLWRGMSKKIEFAKEKVEERPLFISVDKKEGELVFSSISSFLFAQRPFNGVSTIPGNQLIRWTGEKLVLVHEYPRNDVGQYRKYEQPATTYWANKSTKEYTYSSNRYVYYKHQMDGGIYTLEGKELHGLYYITRLGKALKDREKDSLPVHFFHGIPMKSEEVFKFLEKCHKKSKLTTNVFISKNENIIRYLSLSQVYTIENCHTVKAISPTEFEPYTGTIHPFGENWATEYSDGKYVSRKCLGYDEALKPLTNIPKVDLELGKKLLKRLC